MEMHWIYITLIFLGGMAIGGVIAWQYAKSKINPLKTELKILESARETLGDTFKSLSADALKTSNEEFLKLAKLQLSEFQTEAKGELDLRKQAVETLVNPIRESLGKVEENIRNLETAREGAYKELLTHVKTLAVSQKDLQSETVRLTQALSSPTVSGRWGELQLQRILELTGMKEFYDFVEQKGFTEEEKRFIPDVVVRLPGNKNIVIDAKVSTDAYLKANKAVNETEKQKHLEAYLSHIRNHIQTLKSKKYWEAVPDTTEFVIMFIPGENFLQAALDQDPTLIESAARNNVLLGSPTTLITLLKAVAYGWRQEEVARNALKIKDAGQKLYKRIGTFIGHFDGVRKGLDRATDSYNSAVGSLQTRVLPAAKSLNELGFGEEDDFSEISRSEKTSRAIEVPDLTGDDS